jgi:hypothetical protein
MTVGTGQQQDRKDGTRWTEHDSMDKTAWDRITEIGHPWQDSHDRTASRTSRTGHPVQDRRDWIGLSTGRPDRSARTGQRGQDG